MIVAGPQRPHPDGSGLEVRVAGDGDREAWDHFVLQRGPGVLLQTWGWGALKARWGWRPVRLVAVDGSGQLQGALQLLLRPVAGLGCYAYGPRGPVLADLDAGQAAALRLIAAARRLARRRRALVLKLDPEWRTDDAAARRILRAAGLRASPYDVQHRKTYLVDLSGGPAAVFARVKASTRRQVRRAEGTVAVEADGGPAAVATFHRVLARTVARTELTPRPLAYYQDVVAELATSCPVRVLCARMAGEPVSAMVAVVAGSRLIYLFGGSVGRPDAAAAAYRMHWQAIEWGLAQGCTTYDMWGVPNHEDPAVPGAGYFEFKRRWNGEVVRHHRCQDVVLWPELGPLPRLVERLALRGRPLLS